MKPASPSQPPRVLVTIDAAFAAKVSQPGIQQIVTRTLAASGPGTAVEVSITIGGDELLWELNRHFRGHDRPTDVLAFALQEEGGLAQGGAFVPPPDAVTRLGDVCISYPRVEAQAQELGHPEWHELAFLLVHGTLHLLGDDHQTEAQRAAMHHREEVILGQLGLARPS